MEKLKWRMMMIIMVVVRMKVDSECCLEDEIIALVELKAHINSIDHSTSSSWGTNLECCSWAGVGCNNNGRVAQLNLGQTDWTLDWITVDLQLNASLFLPFQQLDSLNLAGYNIAGCLPNHGFEKLSTLAKLEHLDLSDNRLDNSILPSLSHLLSLKYLNLTSNRLRGTIDKSELNNLTSLRELDFTGNKIEGFGTLDGSEEPTLPNLEVLRLGFNVLNNTIFQRLSYLSNLKILGLEGNRLDRKIHTSELNNLRNLRELDISENAIEGFQSLLQGGKGFLKLEKLESLNLRLNYFKNDILPFLRGLPSLQTLDLSYNQFKGPFNLEELDGLSKLEELDLSGNEITKFVSNKEDADYKGPANISILYLDNMTTANENSNLIQQLGVLWPNLNTLSLRLNNLQGQTFDSNNIGRKVEEVYLDYCLIDEIFLQSLSRTFPSLKVLSLVELSSTLSSQGFPTFDNLEHMYLNGTLFSNHSLPNLETMRSLKTLSLPKCGLSGKIYAGLCELKHLEQLDMQDNNLIGELPWCLANLTSLRLLTLAYNQLTGSISFSPLQSLTSLHYLDISNNLFRVPISLAPFFNHSLLKHLSLYNNTIFTDTSSATMTPKFQLEYLYFRGFGEAGSIPKFLYYQHSLQEVLLSNINLRGNFPYWLLDNNTRLQSLFLPYNLLSGPLRLPSTPHLNLWYLGVSNNFFNGSIPAEMGTYLPGLIWLDLSMNSIDGTIPDSLCKPSLYMMDLSRNHISGTIPFCVGKMSQLGTLDLSRNNIVGSLPLNFSPLSVMMVALSHNRLQGPLNNAFHNCLRLFILNLNNNKFVGAIPSWFGTLSLLSYILLRNNNFQGNIPSELCNLKKLSLADFSHNNISGHIPPCLSFVSYRSWQEGEVPFSKELEFTTKGNSYDYQSSVWSYLSGLDLSNNSLTGEIPQEIGNFGDILVLNLSHNSLTGRIPVTISNLKEIESIDLSFNNLEGWIPDEITRLQRISNFNVSYNNLSGTTPSKVAQFATFDESSYRGNPFLCGWPIQRNCSPAIYSPRSPTLRDGFVDMEAFYESFGLAYGMAVLVLLVLLCKNRNWRAIWFYYVQMCIDKIFEL